MARYSREYYKRRVLRDLALAFVGACAAYAFARSGILDEALPHLSAPWQLVAFISGVFFTSGFTILPATVALATLSKTVPLGALVLWGALGAAVGDFILFFFVRDVFAEDLRGMLKLTHFRNILSAPKLGFMHWFTPLVGALIVASPLPDEIGIAMMGISRLSSTLTFALLFLLNVIGVASVAFVASVFG